MSVVIVATPRVYVRAIDGKFTCRKSAKNDPAIGARGGLDHSCRYSVLFLRVNSNARHGSCVSWQ